MTVGHEHAISPAARNQRRLVLVLSLTGTFLVAEVAAGFLTGSLALLADAGHMLTDAGGLVLALVGIRLAQRPATPERTYGYYRAEILAALTNAVLLIGISLFIVYEAYGRLRSPPEVASGPMMAVAALGALVNVAAMLMLRGSAEKSLNMKAAYFEVVSDLLTSAAVLAGGVVMLATGWYIVDPILSAGIGLFILPRTWRLLREAVGVLLEGTPASINVPAVREMIAETCGVKGVHDLHIWSLTSGMNAMSVHVVVGPDADHARVRQAIRERISDTCGIEHQTIQVELPGEEEAEVHL